MEQIIKFFTDFGENFDSFCDKYLVKILICLAVIAVFLALKFVLGAIAKRIIRKINEKNKDDNERIKAINGIILPPLRVLVIDAALLVCVWVLQLEGETLVIADRVLVTLLMYAIFRGLFGLCDYIKLIIIKAGAKKGGAPHTLAYDFIAAILKVLVVVIGVLTIMQQWMINVTSMLAGLSIGGVALALAAQDTASNIFGALSVIFERPFEIGDFVELGGISGTVEKMGMRSTQVRQLNQALVYVPNSKLASDNIINWRMLSNRRVETKLGVLYSTTPELLEKFIEGLKTILTQNEKVVTKSALVTFTEFDSSSLNVEMRYLISTSDLVEMNVVREQVNFAVLRLAAELGVGFAFPSTSVYMEN